MFRFLLIALLSFFLVVPGVQAQKIVEELKRPMPEFESMMPKDFDSVSVLHEETPFDDAHLSYRVRLPKDWVKPENTGTANFSNDQKVLGEIARYHGPVRWQNERSSFSVQAVGLDYQLTAEQWFIQFILENGNTLRGLKVHSDKRVEAIYVLVRGDVTFAVRAVAEINGKRVVVAQYTMPMEEWKAERQIQERVMDSFRLTNRDLSLAEAVEPYQFLDIAQMQYPVSWELRSPAVRSIDRMQVQLFNIVERKTRHKKTRVLNGKMEVHLTSGYVVESLEDEIARFKASLETNGLILKDLIDEPEDFVFHDDIEFAYTTVHKAIDNTQSVVDYELWMTIMAADEYYYFLTLLTPSRNEDYFKWSRNTQSFRVVNRLIAPLDQKLRD